METGGIRTYSPQLLLSQKLLAVEGRTAPRDIYDIAFLVEKFPETLTPENKEALHAFLKKPNEVEARFRNMFEKDPVLRHKDFDAVMLTLLDKTKENAPTSTGKEEPNKALTRPSTPTALKLAAKNCGKQKSSPKKSKETDRGR